MTILLTTGFDRAFPLKSYRAEDEQLAEFINAQIEPNDLLLEWASSTPVMPFMTNRDIPRFDHLGLLQTHVRENIGKTNLFIILPYSELSLLEQVFEFKILYRTEGFLPPDERPVCVQIIGLK